MADAAPSFNASDVSIVTKDSFRACFFELRRYELSYKLAVGGWSPVLPAECLMHDGTVAVLPYDPYADKVVLVERFRVGAMEELAGPWQLELPSGMYDPEGLGTEDRAFIEAESSAKLKLMDIEMVSRYLSSPGFTNEMVYLYCGGVVVDQADVDHWAGGLRDEMTCHLMDRTEAFHAMQEGYINNAATIIALQWLQLNVERLRDKWR